MQSALIGETRTAPTCFFWGISEQWAINASSVGKDNSAVRSCFQHLRGNDGQRTPQKCEAVLCSAALGVMFL